VQHAPNGEGQNFFPSDRFHFRRDAACTNQAGKERAAKTNWGAQTSERISQVFTQSGELKDLRTTGVDPSKSQSCPTRTKIFCFDKLSSPRPTERTSLSNRATALDDSMARVEQLDDAHRNSGGVGAPRVRRPWQKNYRCFPLARIACESRQHVSEHTPRISLAFLI
jgi:hypothetical protein